MNYYSLNQYLKDTFGQKVYKIAIDAGLTCPNRDGKIGYGGCVFCSAGGSGEFAGDRNKSITQQIEEGKSRVLSKMKSGGKFIAYFQAFTGTYGDINYLKKIYKEAANHPDVVAISIATRPDCVSDEIIEILKEIHKIKPVWIELGLQTIHEKSVAYIRRGYPNEVYEKCIQKLKEIEGIHIVTHVILGLPGESASDMLDTVSYVVDHKSDGIKLQLLHVLKGTDLANDYRAGRFDVLSLDEYIDIVKKCIEIIPSNMVVHRITGDGDKKLLIAPLWSGDKKMVLNALNHALKEN